jgi:hypothetical protein
MLVIFGLRDENNQHKKIKYDAAGILSEVEGQAMITFVYALEY